jgi:hypothetical protein
MMERTRQVRMAASYLDEVNRSSTVRRDGILRAMQTFDMHARGAP